MSSRLCTHVALAFVLLAGPASAHHGAAAYDLARSVSFDGTLAALRWSNPHALIDLDVAGEHGEVRRWTAETAGLTILLRAGWSKALLPVGSRVTLVGHPARNGTATMILERLVLADGRVLGNFVPR